MKQAWKAFRRISPYARPYRKLAVLSLVYTFLAAGVAVALPWPLALTFDSVLGNNPLPAILAPLGSLDRYTLLILAVLALLGLKAAEGMVDVLNNYVTTKLKENIVLDLRGDMFQHAQRLSPAYHAKRRTGSFALLFTMRASAAGIIVVAIPQLLGAIVTLVAMFVVASFIDVPLALLALSVVPFIYYSTGRYARRIEPRLMKVRGMEGKSVSIAHEAISMLRVVVPFTREPYEYRRFRDQGENAVDARVDITVRQSVFSMVINVIAGVGTALVLGFGAYRILQGQMSGGSLLVVITYVAAAYAPLQQIAATFSMLQEQFIHLRGALGMLSAKPEVEDSPGAYDIGRVKGNISFEGVHFSYAKRKREQTDTLKDISFEARAGQRVAIVGPTSAGKTTLINLIMRFFDPHQGRVLVDGIDIRKLTLRSLREQISNVTQEPLLFSGTIADNIRYGRLDASMEEVKAAAKAANAHQFIVRKPNEYNFRLGEGGAALSGGERQRITIARAFLKDAPILILDEPTASIDSRTEAVILNSLKHLMVGRTTIMITHRLSTIRNADLILVLGQGRLVEKGTHKDLVERRGLYKQLHDAQSGRARQKKRPGQFQKRQGQKQDVSAKAPREPDKANRNGGRKAEGKKQKVQAQEEKGREQPQGQHRSKQGSSVEAFVTASPNRAGAGPGGTTISWSTGEESSHGQVYVSKDGGPERLFAGDAKGTKKANWILPNATYEFRLYAGKERSTRLATAKVARSDNTPQEPNKDHRNGGKAQRQNREGKALGSQLSSGSPGGVKPAHTSARDTSSERLTKDVSQRALTASLAGAESGQAAHELERIDSSEGIHSKSAKGGSKMRHLAGVTFRAIITAERYIRRARNLNQGKQ